MSIKTCPECGALITPQLARCRQCGSYLHGTALEGFLMRFLPAPMASSPGTALIGSLIVLQYLVMVVRAIPSSPFAFSSYTLVHAGVTHGPSILLGEWWRVVTANFIHHDIVHLAFNLWALVIVGPLIEKLFDRKKMLLLTIVSGVVSMTLSHLWYVYAKDGAGILVVSGGASGAISGLIGAALVGAKRFSPPQPHIAAGMRRWAFIMLVFGLVVPGINNAAHGGGFVAGLLLARLMPTGITQTTGGQRSLSLVVGALFLVVAGAFALQIHSTWGTPGSLRGDAQPLSVFGFQVGKGTDWEDSAQVEADNLCTRALISGQPVEVRHRVCAWNVRINPHYVPGYMNLADIEDELGNPERAEQLRAVAERISAR